jgi:hypothetical protein
MGEQDDRWIREEKPMQKLEEEVQKRGGRLKL